MNIGGYGSGFSGFGGRSRSDDFRRGRQVGQKVRGRLLKWITNDTAWVAIDGHKLVAALQSRHPAGTILTFIIKALSPDIVLKEVLDFGQGIPTLNLASQFETARTLFENKMRPHIANFTACHAQQRSRLFLTTLQEDEPLREAYLDSLNCLKSINDQLDTAKGALLFHPWFMPQSRRQLTLLQADTPSGSALVKWIHECELETFGLIRIEFMHKSPDTAYRLKIQKMGMGSHLKRYLASRKYEDLGGTPNCLGIDKLPQGKHGGLLAELLFK